MAGIVLTDCCVTLDDVEVSGITTKVALSYSSDAVDQTAMGLGTKVNANGLKQWGAQLEFLADEVLSAAFFDLVGGEAISVAIRPTTAAVSPTNPSYEGLGIVTDFGPIEGSVGDSLLVSMTIACAGPLSRVTSVEE